MNHHSNDYNKLAIAATLHCLSGCAIGEITGLVIGSALGLSNAITITISIALAFFFGYLLSLLPLLKYGVNVRQALVTVFAADTLSIVVMEITDNTIMAIVPGAMDAGLVNPIFWATMPVALLIAFFVAVPVNKYLLQKGKGHALVHASMHHG